MSRRYINTNSCSKAFITCAISVLAFRIKPNSLSEIYACIIAISLIAHYLYSLTGPAIRASQTTINGCPTMLPRTMRAANIGTIRPCVICIICISCCAPIRTGGNPRLNLSSEGHGADQGERHQDGGEEAEETMGNLGFS